MTYSFIIPVYNRPDEVQELLASLAQQTVRGFEVVVVEDGSTVTCQHVVARYAQQLQITYCVKPNGGPAAARNYGAVRAEGEYLLILDSDCVLPPTYLQAVEEALQQVACDAFGGPDRAHEGFTPIQKAVNYAMTSFFTTGGIRGGKRKLDKFYPRSFNMGVKRSVYNALGGFSADMRFGEDIDFSIRVLAEGYRSQLFPETWVWHKRRTSLRKFFKQVHNSGIARIHLYKRYPSSLKVVHMLPALFTIGLAVVLLMGFFCWWLWCFPPLFAALIFLDAARVNGGVKIAALAVAAAYTQLTGYGTGFLRAWWRRCVLQGNAFTAFDKTFYD